MSNIRLAFYKGPTAGLASWAIKFWTVSRYDHCEVIFPDGRSLRADGNRGVVWNTITDPSVWEVWTVPVTIDSLLALNEFAHDEVGCGYDWKGIFLAQFLPFRREDPAKWFCSELCAAALLKAGLPLARKPFAYSPGALRKELSRMPGLTLGGGVGALP